VGELGINAPVARLVGVGQSAAAHLATQPHVIEFGRLRAQTRLDVAQAFAVGQLREGHRQKLVQAAESANVEIAVIFRHQTAKGMPRRELHKL
jgi:predicted nucleic acid-binding protein